MEAYCTKILHLIAISSLADLHPLCEFRELLCSCSSSIELSGKVEGAKIMLMVTEINDFFFYQ